MSKENSDILSKYGSFDGKPTTVVSPKRKINSSLPEEIKAHIYYNYVNYLEFFDKKTAHFLEKTIGKVTLLKLVKREEIKKSSDVEVVETYSFLKTLGETSDKENCGFVEIAFSYTGDSDEDESEEDFSIEEANYIVTKEPKTISFFQL